MQDGVVLITRWWLLAACGRNPLVRAVDRLELLVIALAILVGLFAAAGAGALGTAVHEARSSTYAAEAQVRRSATAPPVAGASIQAGANVGSRQRIGAPQTYPVSQQVDPQMGRDLDSGRRVEMAHSTSRATAEAIGIACVAWQAVVIVVASLVWRNRSRCDHTRDALWEKDIRELLDDGGRIRD
jgi:hypothetical protein